MSKILKITLAELIDNNNPIIQRQAMGIFKELQRLDKNTKNKIEYKQKVVNKNIKK